MSTKKETIELKVRFGKSYRGHSWGKFYPGKNAPDGDWEWVKKEDKTFYLTEPGFYVISYSDGISQKSKSTFIHKAE